MAKGNPNDASKKLNFVAKVYDPTAKAYRPIYILPDATDKVQGGVYLSDSVSASDAAATGVVAATPKAVKSANDNANNRLSKTTTTAQTVASAVTFTGQITANGGVKGDLTGNADTATKLKTARTFSVKAGANGTAGTGSFDGSGNVSITIPTIDGTAITGTVPLSSIPQGALERLVRVADQAARFKLTTSNVQLGDSVLQLDTGVMYVVVDEANLSSAAGYQEYKASTALNASHAASADSATKATNADNATKATKDSAGNTITSTYVKSLSASGRTVTYTKGDNTTGTFTTQDTTYSAFAGATSSAAGKAGLVPAPAAGSQVKFLRGDGTWQTAGAVTGVKGNTETSYRTGNVNITPANIGALSLAGGQLTGELQSVGIVPVANNTSNLGSTSFKWANVYATTFNGNATTATTASRVNKTLALTGNVTGSVSLNADGQANLATTLANSSVITSKINDSAVTTAKIANSAVTNAKLADDVGTVYVGSVEPTEEHIKLWVKI